MSMAATYPTKAASPLDILLVEDQPEILASMRDALGKRGHRVTAAVDGPQALDRVEGRRFDVAICDVRLPRPDSFELLRRIHRLQPESELILMSPSGTTPEVPPGLDQRSLHQMSRPVDLERLLGLIGRMAEQRTQGGRASETMPARPPLEERRSDAHARVDGSMPKSGARPIVDGQPLERLVEALKQFERGYLIKALNHCDWQRTRTADMLGISRKTLWQKLKQHRIAESEAT